MVDLTGIYNALLEQWEKFPSISQNQFVNGVESRGIATASDANLYVVHFIQAAVDLALLNEPADWDSLQARVSGVGLERATRASLSIHQRVSDLAEHRIARLEVVIAAFDEAIAELDRLKPNAVLGRAQIESHFPASELRDDTIAVLNRGIGSIDATRPSLIRRRDAFAEELAALGS
jgi:hypothetical protein